jgi:hypothetical protein
VIGWDATVSTAINRAAIVVLNRAITGIIGPHQGGLKRSVNRLTVS